MVQEYFQAYSKERVYEMWFYKLSITKSLQTNEIFTWLSSCTYFTPPLIPNRELSRTAPQGTKAIPYEEDPPIRQLVPTSFVNDTALIAV